MSNPPGTPRDDGELSGNFLHSFQSENVSLLPSANWHLCGDGLTRQRRCLEGTVTRHITVLTYSVVDRTVKQCLQQVCIIEYSKANGLRGLLTKESCCA